jgi:hypothetical protein
VCKYIAISKLFQRNTRRKSNDDICIADEVEFVVDDLI